MMILTFITAVLVSLVFERQERRQAFEESLEYRRMGKEMPKSKLKLPLLESWLNITLGIFILGFGVILLGSIFYILNEIPSERFYSEDWEFVSVIIATGIALVLLGSKSVRQHRYKA
jgi:4-amino-4-deoxy-L-arabinose transferase-like glycosyltransferase